MSKEMEDKLQKTRKKMKKPKNVLVKAYIGTIIFLIFGVIAFVVGCYLAKWDIWSWFFTGQAYLVYAIAGLLVLGGGYLVYMKRVNHDDE